MTSLLDMISSPPLPPDTEKLLKDRVLLRDALVGMVGTSDREELLRLMTAIRLTRGNEEEQKIALNAIVALLETA